MSSRFDEKPSLSELGALAAPKDDKINVYERISTDYESFGYYLLEDKDGAIIQNIKGDNRRNATRINSDIVRLWLRGEGLTPKTWKTFIGVLNDIGLKTLAEKINQAVATRLETQPTLDELGTLDVGGGEIINVFQSISTDYENFGYNILDDKYGEKVDDIISGESGASVPNLCREVVKRWLKGTGKSPKNYRTFIEALRVAVGLNTLANEICQALSPESVIPPEPQGKVTTGPKQPKKGTSLADSPGIAILINCDYTDYKKDPPLDPLPGTNEDAREMEETFRYLNYVVHKLHNPTSSQIVALLDNISSELAKYDFKREEGERKVIIFSFSGHGDSNKSKAEKLYANDGEILDLHIHIMRPLIKHMGVYFVPKLFFIDACRGAQQIRTKSAGVVTTKGPEDEGVLVEKGSLSSSGNYYVGYATIPFHVSYATTKGSMWMPKVARALRSENEAFTLVVGKVQREVHLNLGDANKQQCESVNRLNVCPLYLHKRQ